MNIDEIQLAFTIRFSKNTVAMIHIQSSFLILISLLESFIVICNSQGDTANTISSQSPSSHHVEIDWSEFGNLVEIDKDSEWKNYQKETLTTKEKQQGQQYKQDVNVQIKSISERGIKDAKKRLALQKNDPEKYEWLRRNKLERRKQRRILQNQSMTTEEKQKRAENLRRIKETYKAKHKERTGFTRPESIRLKKIRERERNNQATPKELARLEKVRKSARENQKRYNERKKFNGINPPQLT